MVLHFHQQTAIDLLQLDVPGCCHLLDEISECAGAVITLGKCRIELEQGALQKSQLRRNFPIVKNLQSTLDKRYRFREIGTIDTEACTATTLLSRLALRALRWSNQVFVGNELMTVLLQNDTCKRAPANDQNLLIVLFEFFHQGNEIAIPADNDEGINMVAGKRHFQGVQREI